MHCLRRTSIHELDAWMGIVAERNNDKRVDDLDLRKQKLTALLLELLRRLHIAERRPILKAQQGICKKRLLGSKPAPSRSGMTRVSHHDLGSPPRFRILSML
jgi:hypothetical protein